MQLNAPDLSMDRMNRIHPSTRKSHHEHDHELPDRRRAERNHGNDDGRLDLGVVSNNDVVWFE